MKTVLLWDPRFPERAPTRLTLDDAVASAIVRSGVGAPAVPADYATLNVGGALDPGSLVEIVLQHGYHQALRRVFVPLSVAQVAIGLGLAAAIGIPITSVPVGSLLSEDGKTLLTEDGNVLILE